MRRIIAFIPARFASSRLPGKPLAPIAGKPLIQHVYERVAAAHNLDAAYIATDSDDIAAAAAAQQRLLTAAADLVAPGGTLVYAVCSLQPEEGRAQIDALLESGPDPEPPPATGRCLPVV
jgi:3-deoxy-manno-octulosonate cytidylyltransferase (CMP-KDO synthetase)